MEERTILKKIEAIVCAGEEVRVEWMHRSPRGRNYLTIPKMIIMALARDVYKMPFACIGAFYNRNHADAMNAQVKVKNWCDTDKEFKAKYKDYVIKVSGDMPGLNSLDVLCILQQQVKEGLEELKRDQTLIDSIINRTIKKVPEEVFQENDTQ